MKARPSLEKRRKELQRQEKKRDKDERRRVRKMDQPEPGAGPPIEELALEDRGIAHSLVELAFDEDGNPIANPVPNSSETDSAPNTKSSVPQSQQPASAGARAEQDA